MHFHQICMKTKNKVFILILLVLALIILERHQFDISSAVLYMKLTNDVLDEIYKALYVPTQSVHGLSSSVFIRNKTVVVPLTTRLPWLVVCQSFWLSIICHNLKQ